MTGEAAAARHCSGGFFALGARGRRVAALECPPIFLLRHQKKMRRARRKRKHVLSQLFRWNIGKTGRHGLDKIPFGKFAGFCIGRGNGLDVTGICCRKNRRAAKSNQTCKDFRSTPAAAAPTFAVAVSGTAPAFPLACGPRAGGMTAAAPPGHLSGNSPPPDIFPPACA